MRSFRARMIVLWALLSGVCAVLIFVVWMANRAGPEAQIAAARTEVAQACQAVQLSHRRLVANEAIHDRTLLNIVTDLSLRDEVGVEGGIWDPSQGFLAYAFPSHEAAAPKTDMPVAERPAIESLVRGVSTSKPSASSLQRGRREVGVLAACGLANGQVAWTFTRVASAEALAIQRVAAIAVAALALLLLAGIWLLVGLHRWSRKLAEMEATLAARTDLSQGIALTGERDLDRLAFAFNASARHAHELSLASQELSSRLAHSERLAAVGRLAAAMAHEIRNPLGSIRLRAENALAASGDIAMERRDAALRNTLKVVDRLESLVNSLLALTRQITPRRVPTVVEPWLRDIASSRAEEAISNEVRLEVDCPADLGAEFDPDALRRAVDNLLQNALQHAPAGSAIRLRVACAEGRWSLSVTDQGRGVDAPVRAHLFEPFASSRSTGTGLGLAIAREIVEAHGGTLSLVDDPSQAGTTFRMELPWHES